MADSMEFKVGEGLTDEQKKRAKQEIERLSQPLPHINTEEDKIFNLVKGIPSFLVDSVREITTRPLARTFLSAKEFITQSPQEYKPTGVASVVLGERPIESYQTIGKGMAGVAKKFGFSGNLAIPLAVGFGLIDWAPGLSDLKLLRTGSRIAKLESKDLIEKEVKKIVKADPETIGKLSEELVDIKDKDAVVSKIKEAVIKSKQAAGKVAPETTKPIETEIPKELEQLKKRALEIAKKYPNNPEKGAEEFVKDWYIGRDVFHDIRTGKILKSDIPNIVKSDIRGPFERNRRIFNTDGSGEIWSLYWSARADAGLSHKSALDLMNKVFDIAKNFKNRKEFIDFYNKVNGIPPVNENIIERIWNSKDFANIRRVLNKMKKVNPSTDYNKFFKIKQELSKYLPKNFSGGYSADDFYKVATNKDFLEDFIADYAKAKKISLYNQAIKQPVEKGVKPEITKQLEQSTEKIAKDIQDLNPVKLEENRLTMDDEKLVEQIKERLSGKSNKLQDTLYHLARQDKFAKVAAIREKEGGLVGYFAEKSALKGEMPKVVFEPIIDAFDKTSIDRLFDMVNKKLGVVDGITAKNGLYRALTGQVVRRSEVKQLKKVFGDDFAKLLLKRRPLFDKIYHAAFELYNLPRSFVAGFLDFSATFTQNLFLSARHPIFTAKNFVESVDAFGETLLKNRDAAEVFLKEIETRPSASYMERAGLSITRMGETLSEREELYMSPLAEKIPVLGRLIRATGSAYTVFLDKMRADVFDTYFYGAKLAGVNIEDDKFLKALGRFINDATGRGSLGKGGEKFMPLLAQTLFSARKLVATFDMINPVMYVKMPSYLKKKALEAWLAFTGMGMTTLGLSKLAGAEVGDDITSADYGKIKIGNTRFNVFGPYQGMAVLLGRLWQGYMTSSTTGRKTIFNSRINALTRLDVIERFFSMKEHPTMAYILAALRGKDVLGRKFDVKKSTLQLFVPMVFQDMYDLYVEHGAKPILFFGTALSALGIPTQTYSPTIRFNERITSEIRKLQKAGYNDIVGTGAFMPGYPSLSLKENNSMQRYAEKLANYEIALYMNSQAYTMASERNKALRINRIVRNSINKAKMAAIRARISRINNREELLNELRKMKGDGLLNKELFLKLKRNLW